MSEGSQKNKIKKGMIHTSVAKKRAFAGSKRMATVRVLKTVFNSVMTSARSAAKQKGLRVIGTSKEGGAGGFTLIPGTLRRVGQTSLHRDQHRHDIDKASNLAEDRTCAVTLSKHMQQRLQAKRDTSQARILGGWGKGMADLKDVGFEFKGSGRGSVHEA